MSESLRFAVRVRPGASRTRVGGRYGEGPDAALVVAVTQRAVDGAATDAALRAIAAALALPRRALTVVAGATARTKVVAVTAPPADLPERLARLLDG